MHLTTLEPPFGNPRSTTDCAKDMDPNETDN